MNWYKKCLASKNIFVHDKTKKDAFLSAKKIKLMWNDFYNSGLDKIFVSYIEIIDIYSNFSGKIKIFLRRRVGKSVINPSAEYDKYSENINVYPENMVLSEIIKSVGDYNSVNEIYFVIMHEIIHIIDPKLKKGIISPTTDLLEDSSLYYSKPSEFDAWSKQISEALSFGCLENKKEVKEWLISEKILPLPKCLNQQYAYPLFHWSKNKTLIKKFKQRIYNEISKKL